MTTKTQSDHITPKLKRASHKKTNSFSWLGISVYQVLLTLNRHILLERNVL